MKRPVIKGIVELARAQEQEQTRLSAVGPTRLAILRWRETHPAKYERRQP